MIKRVKTIIGITIFFIILYSLSHQIVNALQAGKRLDQAVLELTALQEKNSELKKRLAMVESIEFVEEQARDKLNLSRPGETIVVLPQHEIDRVLGINQVLEGPKLANWQKWIHLFF